MPSHPSSIMLAVVHCHQTGFSKIHPVYKASFDSLLRYCPFASLVIIIQNLATQLVFHYGAVTRVNTLRRITSA